MCAVQLVIGLLVIEILRVEDDDVLLAPLMIRMACGAGLIDWRDAAVKSLGRLVIRCDLLVAIEAELRLRALVEREVTGFALALEFGVLRRQSARRDELLHDVLRLR